MRLADVAPPAEGRGRIPLRVIGWAFLTLGATAFGGQGVALDLIEREWVGRRRLLTSADVDEAWSRARVLPGSAIIGLTSSLGHRLGGWAGSTVATAAFLLPSVLAMLALAASFELVPARILPPGAVGGLMAAVAGLLLASALRRGRAVLEGTAMRTLALATLAAGLILPVHAAWLVVAAGLFGAALRPQGRGRRSEGPR